MILPNISKYSRLNTVLIFLFVLGSIQAQIPATDISDYDDIVVTENNAAINFPFAEGLGHPIYSNGDFNNDGIEDLFIFDAFDNTVQCYLRNENMELMFDRSLNSRFPKMKTWTLLVDFNCDNIPDLFTNAIENDVVQDAISLYVGSYDADGLIVFTLLFDKLMYEGNTEMFSFADNLPAITDVDDDGDIDILAYKTSSAKQVVFYRNDTNGDCNVLNFTLDTDCFGDFNDNMILPLILNVGCDFLTDEEDEEENLAPVHGISSLLFTDTDVDGLKELLIGNEFYNSITALYNDGTIDSAHFYLQDNTWPMLATPIELPSLPTLTELDINMDGKKDLIVSVRGNSAGHNYAVSQLYLKGENDEFDLTNDIFFTPNMIDCGSYSAPVFFDTDADGLLDIVVGNLGYFDPLTAYTGALTLYKNVGTATAPAFELTDRDYLNLSIYGEKYLVPTFGDLDGDGDDDLLIGLDDGKLFHFENTAGSGNTPTFIFGSTAYQDLDIGNHSSPQIIDLNRDGLVDILVGAKPGFMVYFQNNGTVTDPLFDTQLISVGQVDTRTEETQTGYAAPFVSDLETPGEYILYAGSESGELFRYVDIENNLAEGDAFVRIDSAFAGIDPGVRSKIAIADIDNDSYPELLIGNSRGGLRFYNLGMEADTMSNTTVLGINNEVIIFPNPVNSNRFNIRMDQWDEDLEINLFAIDGKRIGIEYSRMSGFIKVEILEEIVGGIYFVEIKDRFGVISRKISME